MVDDYVQQFRLVVRNYSKLTGMPISEVVEFLIPGFVKHFEETLRKAFPEQTDEHPSKHPTYKVYRWDNNSKNTHTYRSWVFVTSFDSLEMAEDFVKRASSLTQSSESNHR